MLRRPRSWASRSLAIAAALALLCCGEDGSDPTAGAGAAADGAGPSGSATSSGAGGATVSSVTGGGAMSSGGSGGGGFMSHSWDLASAMPPHLAVMFSMSWFGIPASDPQGAGPDATYGNTKWGGGCVGTNAPGSCGTCIRMGAGDMCVETGPAQRNTASRRRMLAGIYSASAADAEGRARIDLMLSNVRRPCDDGAKIDAWAVQLNGTRDTSRHPNNPSCSTCEISYGATLGFFAQADAAGMTNVILPADDATFYFHFGDGLGLGKCDDSSGNPRQACIDALTQDFADMCDMAAAHPSALRVNGKPVVFTYLDPAHLSAAEWQTLLDGARAKSGRDFYAVAAIQNPHATGYFDAFDGVAPWIQINWTQYSAPTVREHAYKWAAGMHDALRGALASYSGRVLFGAMTPGFDDYTMNWGGCKERQLPSGDPRDPDLLLGEFDYFNDMGITSLIGQTWDDWTEGSEFEPDVAGGTTVLLSMRAQLGALFGEAPDPAGDKRLTDRWNAYGQARNCLGGPAQVPPATPLGCP